LKEVANLKYYAHWHVMADRLHSAFNLKFTLRVIKLIQVNPVVALLLHLPFSECSWLQTVPRNLIPIKGFENEVFQVADH
jgi:hypothetical protein